MQDGWKDPDEQDPTPSEVIDVVIGERKHTQCIYVISNINDSLYIWVYVHITCPGMYCMERVGIRHDVKSEVLQFLQSPRAHPAADYFGGWDPRTSAPPMHGNIEVTSDLPISHYRAFSNSLIHAFYADRVGLSR